MKQCKIVHVGYEQDIRENAKLVAEYPSVNPIGSLRVTEYPKLEAIINSYLAQGWELIAMQKYDGVFLRFEQEV